MHSNRRTMLCIAVVVLVLMAALLVQSRRYSQKLAAGDRQIADLQVQTEAEEQRTEDIKELQEYMQTDEYKEKVAKEKLGLVKDGEIVFKEEN